MAQDASLKELSSESTRSVYRGLVVIIPTRNRSDLAMRAIRSTLDAPLEDLVHILVSDNSTEESEIAALGDFCRSLGDDRVQYIRPPEPLRMAEHWEWAFQQALDRYDASHLTLLADRRIYRRGGLHELCNLIQRHPNSVIMTHSDVVEDHVHPIRVQTWQWSGRLLEIRADTLLRANARAIWKSMQLVPTPLISIIPRRVFCQVREQFGDYCLSLAPDYCFGYRVLDIEDSLLIYHKSMTIMLGVGRSNGISIMRGIASKDKMDFIATNGGANFCYWTTPIPELVTGHNGIFHEYNFVRSQSRSGRFPELDVQSCLRFLHWEITAFCEDPDMKSRYLELLASHGFRETEPSWSPTPILPADEDQLPRSFAQRFRDIRAREPNKPLWRLLPERLAAKIYWTLFARIHYPKLLRSKRCTPLWWTLYNLAGVPLPLWLNDIGFSTVDEAIEFLHGRDYNPSPDGRESRILLKNLEVRQ
jgi:hypothetical protein